MVIVIDMAGVIRATFTNRVAVRGSAKLADLDLKSPIRRVCSRAILRCFASADPLFKRRSGYITASVVRKKGAEV